MTWRGAGGGGVQRDGNIYDMLAPSRPRSRRIVARSQCVHTDVRASRQGSTVVIMGCTM